MSRWTQADVDARVYKPRHPNGIDAVPTRNGNIPTDGFASKREAKRFGQLMLMELAGDITNLRNNRDHKAECTFELIPAQYVNDRCVERSCKYICDFRYVEDGLEIVEDAKGFRESVYRIKRKLMLSIFGIRVRET